MDLQGIGAIASAAVALVGIPAAVLVGHAQTKAAVRAAQLAAEAGRVQAEAAYRAALHSVRDQARAEHRQWRHSLRREAWANFASAVNDVRVAAEDLIDKTRVSDVYARIDEASVTSDRALSFAVSVVELEGPPEVAEPAIRLHTLCQQLLAYAAHAAIIRRAESTLDAIEAGDGPADIDDANTARDALHDLRSAVRARDEGDSYPISVAGERAHAVYEAHGRSLTTLAACGITGTQGAALIDEARGLLAPDSRLVTYREAETATTEALGVFTTAARSYLDNDS
jgi:hypothetical protein